jgi:hypothetical protein
LQGGCSIDQKWGTTQGENKWEMVWHIPHSVFCCCLLLAEC